MTSRYGHGVTGGTFVRPFRLVRCRLNRWLCRQLSTPSVAEFCWRPPGLLRTRRMVSRFRCALGRRAVPARSDFGWGGDLRKSHRFATLRQTMFNLPLARNFPPVSPCPLFAPKLSGSRPKESTRAPCLSSVAFLPTLWASALCCRGKTASASFQIFALSAER